MAGSAMKTTNLSAIRERLEGARRDAPQRLRDATEEALVFLEAAAKAILDEEIYSRSSPPPPDKTREESLYKHFGMELRDIAQTACVGILANSSDHAIFVEVGNKFGAPDRHYMERALNENRAAVVAIYRKHFQGLFN